MLTFIANNLGSLLVLLCLGVGIGLLAAAVLRKKRRGEGTCGCGCSSCPMADKCHPKGKGADEKKKKENTDEKDLSI